jgi:hypothetical protein
MLPCAEYILEGPLRILVHLVSDLPKAFVELNDGTACRLKASCLQASHRCFLIFPRNSFCLILSFFRHLLALLICPLASTHNKPPRVYAYLLSGYTKRKRIFFVKKKAIESAYAYCLYYDLPMPRADRRTLSRPAGPSPTSFEHQPLCLRQGERGDESDNRANRNVPEEPAAVADVAEPMDD